MASRARIGLLGLVHDHVWDNLEFLVRSEQGVAVAAADPHEELRQKARREYGIEKTYGEYADLLEQEELDGVWIYSDNATHVPLAEMAADRGLPAMLEKPMARSLADADCIIAAMRRSGAKFMVNWPSNWRGSVRHALDLARQGAIGHVCGTRYRGAHEGPVDFGCSPYFSAWLFDSERSGGGPIIDYCCYGAAFAAYLLGRPARVTGVSGRLVHDELASEDNAIMIMEYHDAISTTEGSWTHIGDLGARYTLIIYGSEGTLQANRTTLLMATREHHTPREVEVPPLPAGEDNAADYFARRVLHDQPIEGLVHPVVGRNAQEILEAGQLSVRRGSAVSLPLRW